MRIFTALMLIVAMQCHVVAGQVSAAAAKALAKFASDVAANMVAGYAAGKIESAMKKPSGQPGTSPPASNRYGFGLSWKDPRNPDILYSGILIMDGFTGNFYSKMEYRGVLTAPLLQEQMTTELVSSNEVRLHGSQPTKIGSTEFVPNMVADNFRLIQVSPGYWTVADTCWSTSLGPVCSPVAVVAAPTTPPKP